MSKRDSKPMVAEDDPGFVNFWNAYPKRVAKKDARIAWAKLNPNPQLVVRIINAVAWQREQPAWTKDGGQYVPYPASWLRAERWTDEAPTVVAPLMSAAVSDPIRQWLAQKLAVNE